MFASGALARRARLRGHEPLAIRPVVQRRGAHLGMRRRLAGRPAWNRRAAARHLRLARGRGPVHPHRAEIFRVPQLHGTAGARLQSGEVPAHQACRARPEKRPGGSPALRPLPEGLRLLSPAARGGHFRRSLDFGTGYDCFDALANVDNPAMTVDQKTKRLMLRALMEKHGFKPYPPEWWHFTLRDEPYPETFFDFEIE